MRKYRNKKMVVDGIQFDSRREGQYYVKLKLLLAAGEISDLRLQVPYEIIPAIYKDEVKHLKTKDKVVRKCVQRATTYVADFVYVDNATGETKVVDTKGFRTKEYKLKKKMMLAFNGIDIIEA